MNESQIYRRLVELTSGDPDGQRLALDTLDIHKEACTLLETVPLYMRQYTLHGKPHVERIVELMWRLLSPAVFERLKPLELAGLILCASLHDIGMCASADEVSRWRNEREQADKTPTDFTSFRATFPVLLERVHRLRAENKHGEAEEIESHIEAEFIRKNHGERLSRIIIQKFADRLIYAGTSFKHLLIDVCTSHTLPPEQLVKIPCWKLSRTPRPGCVSGEHCNWRFVGLLLRLADVLDFDAKRTPRILFEHLGIRGNVSLREWSKHMAVLAWEIGPDRIVFRAECKDPVIQKTIYEFCDIIDGELAAAKGVHDQMFDAKAEEDLRRLYELRLPIRVDRSEIGPEPMLYEYVDAKFSLDHHRIIDLLLGVRLYSESWLFLRELLQNAIDACRHRKAVEDGAGYEPRVDVIVTTTGLEGATLTIRDNGCGMTQRHLCDYFARVGVSYYRSPEFLEQRAKRLLKFKPVSQFGIGFLSAFMAASAVEIETMHHSRSDTAWKVFVANQAALFWFQKATGSRVGTSVNLRLAKDLEDILPKNCAAYWPTRVTDAELTKQHLGKWLATVVANVVGERDVSVKVSVDGVDAAPIREKVAVSFAAGNQHVHAIEFDLKGIDPRISGLGTAYFLRDNAGKWVKELSLSQREFQSRDDTGVTLIQKPGAIERVVETALRSEATQTSWACELDSCGRWRQQGILVPSNLIQGYQVGGGYRGVSAPIKLPFAVQYDLDLDEDLTFSLSVDRRAAIETEENARTANSIRMLLINAVLKHAGKDAVKKNRKFLVDLVHAEAVDQAMS